MTEQQFERLSALVDAHLDQPEITSEISKLIKLDGDRGRWYRYHLMGDAIRQELGPTVGPRLAQQISKRLENEPVALAPSARARKPIQWYKPAAGFAVAASVAAMAMTLAPQFINQQSANQPTEVAAVNQSRPHNLYVADDGTRWDMLQKPKVESRLNSYLVNHQEYAPVGNMKGIMPYASFVSYDGDQ